ncbi:hypothetical protein [Roseivivax sediminis]|uniref:hypothetical protein n=1 Tax=Roseivivax sediminis TaxID=936889 RepID=UPI00165ED91B|nr:hypothetical protein [Roseivivax sediminis]
MTGSAACTLPGPGMYGAPPTRVSEGQSTFLLRRQGNEVEAIRTSVEILPSRAAVSGRAGLAVRRVTGCDIAWMRGDAALLRMGLDCGEGALLPPGRPELDCDVIDEITATGAVYTELAIRCGALSGSAWRPAER